jgi:hypothetical protein
VAGTNGDATPLAEWLLDNSIAQWINSDIAHGGAEIRSVVFAQTSFNFTILFNGGVEGRYTLVGPILSGAPDITLNSQQSSNLQFWLNGPNAVNVAAAKVGGVGISSKKSVKGLTTISPPNIHGNKGYFIVPFGFPLPAQ